MVVLPSELTVHGPFSVDRVIIVDVFIWHRSSPWNKPIMEEPVFQMCEAEMDW